MVDAVCSLDTQDGTQILKSKYNVWSGKVFGSILGGDGRWVRVIWNSLRTCCQVAPPRMCSWDRGWSACDHHTFLQL